MDRVNAFDVVRQFEEAMAAYTGAPYAVAVDTCTAALFLCLKYNRVDLGPAVALPRHTFISVPNSVIHAGGRIKWFDDVPDWPNYQGKCVGSYMLRPYQIWDSAIELKTGMFLDKQTLGELYSKDKQPTFVCLSFQYRKSLPIGRGGMILTDSAEAVEWFKRARFFGRHEVPMGVEPGPTMAGWHMYMEPERAARGLQLLMHLPASPLPRTLTYPDLSQYSIFDNYVDLK